MTDALMSYAAEHSTSFDHDLFEPFVGANVWAPRLGLAAMLCFLIGAYFLTRSPGVVVLLPFVVLIWAGFEVSIRVYRKCRADVRSRGTVGSATIIGKDVTLRGPLRKITVEFARDGVLKKSSFCVSSATYYNVSLGQKVEIKTLSTGIYRTIPPVPIRYVS